MSQTESVWRNRSVLVTGHTGFKGGWLTLWLHHLGAKVHGFALEPPTNPNLFEAGGLKSILASDTRSDIADLARLKATFAAARPDVVFHLAAQPIVLESYRDPLRTLATNVIGTAHVLEAARSSDSLRAMVLITTDKVYENREWAYPYREVDALGGHDPYSASKAAAEMVAASYRTSFFAGDGKPRVATARAGNVIGGADWAAYRLVPDCLRAFGAGQPVRIRAPNAVRPWQHVFEPLSGYLRLAEHLLGEGGGHFASAWNFGPSAAHDATVGEVADMIARLWGDGARVERLPSSDEAHEATLLRLDTNRARSELGWSPRWSLRQALEHSVAWHRAWMGGDDMMAASLGQIRDYESARPS